MATLSDIWIYPVKSLGGVRVATAHVEERGLQYDRRWMIVDSEGTFVTQRTVHEMALIDVTLDKEGFYIAHRRSPRHALFVAYEPSGTQPIQVKIWDDPVEATTVSEQADAWLSQVLGRPLRLVKMPSEPSRPVDPRYAKNGEYVSFADGYPVLVVGQASLNDLNQRLPDPVAMQRFRPNLVVAGTLPYAEDEWVDFEIGSARFKAVKPCARCVLTTLDPATGAAGTEPLKTLATYRKQRGKVLFGMNVLAQSGQISAGDSVIFH